MTSFREKVKKKKESEAYCDGIAFYKSGKREKLVKSPYESNSKADLDWLDGFYDAWYMDIVLGSKASV